METPKKKEDKKKKPGRPDLPALTEFYLDLLESSPGSLSLEKIEEVAKEAERLINQGLRNGKSFEEIKDLQITHKMVFEELKKHPELQKDSDAALKLITRAIVKRFQGPWGRLLLG